MIFGEEQDWCAGYVSPDRMAESAYSRKADDRRQLLDRQTRNDSSHSVPSLQRSSCQ